MRNLADFHPIATTLPTRNIFVTGAARLRVGLVAAAGSLFFADDGFGDLLVGSRDSQDAALTFSCNSVSEEH